MNQQYQVDDSGNITVTNTAPIPAEILIGELEQAQAKVDSLTDALTQVAQAPNADPAIIATLQAIPSMATKLQSIVTATPPVSTPKTA